MHAIAASIKGLPAATSVERKLTSGIFGVGSIGDIDGGFAGLLDKTKNGMAGAPNQPVRVRNL